MDKYPFIFNTSPSPKTVKVIHETLSVHKSKIEPFVSDNDERLKGYVEAYDDIIKDLQELEESLHYKKERS